MSLPFLTNSSALPKMDALDTVENKQTDNISFFTPLNARFNFGGFGTLPAPPVAPVKTALDDGRSVQCVTERVAIYFGAFYRSAGRLVKSVRGRC